MEMVGRILKFNKYPSYKHSGTEWIGLIPEHWKVKKSKFISEIQKGKLPNNIVSSNETNLPPYMSMEYLRGGEENQWVLDKNSKIINENETLLLWDGANAGEFIKSRKGVISSTIAQITFYNIDNNYAWYYSKFLEIELRSKTIGMGIPHVNGTELKNSIVSIPPLSEQTTIAQFLDEKTTLIDKAIAIKQKQIDLLKERRQITIHQAVTRGLNPNAKMKDSGVDWIGEIPEGWEVKRNSLLFLEKKLTGNETLPILSVSIHTAVSNEQLSDEENIRGLVRIDDKAAYKMVKPGYIVYNMMRAWQGGIGSVEINGMVSPAYVVAEPNLSLNSKYFEFQYRTDIFIQQMDQNSRGITDFRKRLYWNEFKQLLTLVPPLDVQSEIVDFINSITYKIATTISLKEQEIEKLKEYKATLINSTVTGKIKVSNDRT